MTAEERERTERRAAWLDEIDEGLAKYPPMGGAFLAQKFPVPDTSSLTAEQAEAVLAKWRAEVNAAMAQLGQPPAVPGGPVAPAQPSAPPGAPVA